MVSIYNHDVKESRVDEMKMTVDENNISRRATAFQKMQLRTSTFLGPCGVVVLSAVLSVLGNQRPSKCAYSCNPPAA